MTDTTYNGWANRETWAVNLWMSNDESSYFAAKEAAARSEETFRELVESIVLGDEPPASLSTDLLTHALGAVNWSEARDAFREELAMDETTYRQLRQAADDESLSYGEIADIEAAFSLIPDDQLRDLRENAMADDMLDEIAAYLGFSTPCHPDCGPITSRVFTAHAHDHPQDGRCWHENADDGTVQS